VLVTWILNFLSVESHLAALLSTTMENILYSFYQDTEITVWDLKLSRRHDVIKFSRAISLVRILEKHDVSGTISVPIIRWNRWSVLPDNGDRDSSRNVVLVKYPDAADSPRRRNYCTFSCRRSNRIILHFNC
jgi:hypothetical protein